MKKRKALTTLLATLTILGPLDALADTTRLNIGHADVDATVITDYDVRFDLTMVGADGTVRPNGYWTDKVSHEEIDGQTRLRRKVVLYDAAGNDAFVRVHLADAKTLAPALVQQAGDPRFGAFFLDYRYQGGHVDVAMVATLGASLQQMSIDLDPAPFDLSIWATFLLSLPFEAGYEAEFPHLGAGGTIAWETARVIGPETLTTPAGDILETFKVETVNRPWTAWLRKDAPHIVKIIQNFPDGSHQISWPVAKGE